MPTQKEIDKAIERMGKAYVLLIEAYAKYDKAQIEYYHLAERQRCIKIVKGMLWKKELDPQKKALIAKLSSKVD